MRSPLQRKRIPQIRHFWFGLLLIAICWPLNWLLPGLRTHLLFFPLWLGYVLVVDALVLHLRGTSLLTRSLRGFISMFLVSVPAWWLFEAINERTHNWMYQGTEQLGDLTYFILSSIAFSTVIPAVFETAELVRGMRWLEHLPKWLSVKPNRPTCLTLFLIGLTMFALVMLWPTYFYPFVWGSVYLMLEPLNARLGRRSLLERLQYGDWRPVIALALGALACGFFWELWNSQASPKWTYNTPGVEFLYIFEMPLLGFIGYLPFALELYALFYLVKGRDPKLNL